MRVIQCEQRSPEWFAARTGVCTASRFKDARDTLKTGKPSQRRLDYMAELALERVTGILTDTYVTPAMQRGSDLEGAARELYCAETGEIVQEMGFALHDLLDIGYSPDGLVGSDGLIEIKCPANAYRLVSQLINGDATDYMDQIQGGMWITGRQWCDLVVYHPSLPLRPIRIERDEKYIEKLEMDLFAFLVEVQDLTAQLRKVAA